MTLALNSRSIDAIDTPALVLDLDSLDRNLTRMSAIAANAGVRLRPHAKAHKCAEIARRQMELGAVGICCQKLSEAEAMIAAGARNVMVTYPIVGGLKLERLAALAKRARISVIADSLEIVAGYADAAQRHRITLPVLVDVYPGGPRGGVEPGAAVVALAREIASTAGLEFAGLHAYNGAAQHVRDPCQRRATYSPYADAVRATRHALQSAGLQCATISGAGTGTYAWEAESCVFTEIQPGSYVFMDADYALNRNESNEPRDFEHSLFVLTTVVHASRPGYVLVDAGVKAVNCDPAPAWVWGRPALTYTPTGDEQGRIEIPNGEPQPMLGDRLLLVPGHCDPTVNLHDEFVCIRSDSTTGSRPRIESGAGLSPGRQVIAIWPVTARGAIT